MERGKGRVEHTMRRVTSVGPPVQSANIVLPHRHTTRQYILTIEIARTSGYKDSLYGIRSCINLCARRSRKQLVQFHHAGLRVSCDCKKCVQAARCKDASRFVTPPLQHIQESFMTACNWQVKMIITKTRYWQIFFRKD